MAQVDTSIYNALGVKPKSVDDFLAEYDRADARKQALQQNALALRTGEMGLAAKQRAMQEQSAVGNLLADPNFDRSSPSAVNALYRAAPTIAPDIAKSWQDYDKTGADIGKTKSETRAKDVETKRKLLEYGVQSLQVAQTPEQAAQRINAGVQQGFWGMVEAQQMLADMPADLAEYQKWRVTQLRAITSAKDQLPSIQNRDTGGAVQTLAVDPFTGQPTVMGSVAKTQSPDNAASVGASYANAAATRDAAKSMADATRDAAKSKYDQDTEMKMADDYRTQSKDFKDVIDAHKRVNAALGSAPKSAAATLAAATSFMKMLDPGSVVRESELGMALKATGAFDRATNYFNTLQRGQVLTESQAKDFKAISDKILEAAKVGQRTVDEHYRGKTKQYGLRQEMVVQDLGQGGGVIDFGSLK